MAWYLTREYGNSVEVSYSDLARDSVKKRFPEVVEKKSELVLPAVFVDGEMVNMGYIDYSMIARAIQKARKGEVVKP